MPRHPDILEQNLASLRALGDERRREYARFCETAANLGPLERVTAWVQYIAGHREADSDLEALVFLASRGHDMTGDAAQVIREWKRAEKDRLAEYNAGTPVHDPTSGRTRRYKRPLAITANDIGAT